MSKSFPIALALEQLRQATNPWTFSRRGTRFGFIDIDLGR